MERKEFIICCLVNRKRMSILAERICFVLLTPRVLSYHQKNAVFNREFSFWAAMTLNWLSFAKSMFVFFFT